MIIEYSNDKVMLGGVKSGTVSYLTNIKPVPIICAFQPFGGILILLAPLIIGF